MPEKEHIERKARYIDINKVTIPTGFFNQDLNVPKLLDWLNSQPTADVAEVKHGEWKLHKDGSGTCNQCRTTQKNVWDYDNWQNYCGVCGAKMGGAKND